MEAVCVEQNLMLSRALVAIYSDPFLRENLAFRGGTALHKLYFAPQVRYSEDIDLVQIVPRPFGEIFDHLRVALGFLPNLRRVQKNFNNTLCFRADSEVPPVMPIKIKVETNCREHFSVLGYADFPFEMKNGWFTGSCGIRTFKLEELLGSKMRALYQRKKGRDLFDPYYALLNSTVDCALVVDCFRRYIEFATGEIPTRQMFVENVEKKLMMPDFISDTASYLRPGMDFRPDVGWGLVRRELVELL